MYKNKDAITTEDIIRILRTCAQMDQMFHTEDSFLSFTETSCETEELDDEDLCQAAGGISVPNPDEL